MADEKNAPEPLKPLKTWSTLAGQRRRPSEYEIVSANTLYNADNPELALELSPDVPMNVWYRRYRTNSPLKHDDWNAFRDPDETVYRKYTTVQDAQETYVDGLLDQHDELGHDLPLTEAWAGALARLYTPARFLMHAAQMCAAYTIVLAPGSTVANCAVFEMADHFRWVSRISYRTAELAKHRPDLGFRRDERRHWKKSAGWQGYREMMERLLATYDWGEAMIALNVVAMPSIDAGLSALAAAARQNGDTLTGLLIDAQQKDSERRNRWVGAFVGFALAREENRGVIRGWVDRWASKGQKAIDAYCKELESLAPAAAKGARSSLDFSQSLAL